VSFGTHANCCPSCSHPLDACTPHRGGPGKAPRAGDLSICFYCGEMLIFEGPELRIRLLGPAEFNALPETNRNQLVICQLTARAYARTFAKN
jgi:hypothetical protein